MARGDDDAMSARWRRAIFSNPIRMSVARTHGVAGWLPHRARRRCATTGEAEERVEDEVRRADPLSVNPGQRPGREDEEICTAVRCRCRCGTGECQRRRSAAHQRRADVPRRCRGLTENVTARAVGTRHYGGCGDGGWRDRLRGRDAALRGMGKMLQTCDEKICRKICKVIMQVVPL